MQSKDIKVGDLLMVENKEEVSCDVVLLATSDPEGTAYIETGIRVRCAVVAVACGVRLARRALPTRSAKFGRTAAALSTDRTAHLLQRILTARRT